MPTGSRAGLRPRAGTHRALLPSAPLSRQARAGRLPGAPSPTWPAQQGADMPAARLTASLARSLVHNSAVRGGRPMRVRAGPGRAGYRRGRAEPHRLCPQPSARPRRAASAVVRERGPRGRRWAAGSRGRVASFLGRSEACSRPLRLPRPPGCSAAPRGPGRSFSAARPEARRQRGAAPCSPQRAEAV